MTKLEDKILEECVKAEAGKPSQIIPIAIKVFEKLIDKKIKQYGYVHTLNELKEELTRK